MIALLTVLSHLFAFVLGGATACTVIGVIMVRDYRHWQKSRLAVRGHDGAAQLTALHDEVNR